jgi:hypothetical protein
MLTAIDGETIARKLGATIKKKSRRHKIAVIRINGKEMGRFGIRRGSGEQNHNYIARQIHVSMREAEEISECSKYMPDYEVILRRQNIYPS